MSHLQKNFYINYLISSLDNLKQEHGNLPLFWRDKENLIQPYIPDYLKVVYILTEVRKTLFGEIVVINHEMQLNELSEWVPIEFGPPLKSSRRSQFSDKIFPMILINGKEMSIQWENYIKPKEPEFFLPPLRLALKRNFGK